MRRSGGRHVRLLAALAVVAALVGVGSGVRSDAGEGPADPGGGGLVAGEDPWFAEQAILLGGGRTVPDVEMVHRRSRFAKTYSTETEGVWRTVVSSAPVHFEGSGGWEDIDTALREADGAFVSGANDFSLEVRPDPEAVVSLGLSGGGSLVYGVESAAPLVINPVGESTVAVEGVADDVRLLIESRPEGIKELIELGSVDVPTEFTFPLDLEGLSPRIGTGAEVEFIDGTGAVVAFIPSLWMRDSSTDPETGDSAWSPDVDVEIVESESGYELVVEPDRAWVEDPARVFPIAVDPTVITVTVGAASSGQYDDTYLAGGGSSHHADATYLRSGRNLINLRSYLRFDVSAADPESVDVLDSTLTLHLESGSCATDAPVVGKVTQAWLDGDSDLIYMEDGDWPGPTTTDLSALTKACPTGEIELSGDPLADLVEGWASGAISNYGIRVRANAESDPSEYKQFSSSEASTGAHRPSLEFRWTYGPQYLQVSGHTEADTAFTSFTGGPTCYPETSEWGVDCRLDLYWKGTPSEDQKTIVLVHRGGWAVSYDDDLIGRRRNPTIMKTADAFAENGYLVAVIDYRQGLRTYDPPGTILLLDFLSEWFHCTQRWEADDVTPFNWPPDDDWIPDAGKPDLPAPCDDETLALDSAPGNQIDESAYAAAADAVDDVQAAVAWVRTDPEGLLATNGLDPGAVFLVGESAGGWTALMANYDPDSTADNHMNVDGTVSMAGPMWMDGLAIADTERTLLGVEDAAPMQLQMWEGDFTVLPGNSHRAGDFDFARQTYGFLMNEGYPVELRSRCGPGHTPEPDSASRFNYSFGEALAFLDGLADAEMPTTGMWFGASTFTKRISQDPVEDRLGTPIQIKVGDYNGDGLDDIFWFGDSSYWGDLCDTVSYAQGDGSFARTEPAELYAAGVQRDPYDSNSATPAETLQPTAYEVGDFDGDEHDDIFWFKSGAGADAIWYGRDDPFPDDSPITGTFCRNDTGCPSISQSGTYDDIAVGDFNGDGYDDVFFYETSGDDLVWYSDGSGSFSATTITSSLDGTRNIVVGNFNGDDDSANPIDDLYIYSTSSADGELWYGKTAGGFDRYDEDNDTDFDTVVVGNFNGDVNGNGTGTDDLFWDDTASTTDALWYGQSTAGDFDRNDEDNSRTGTFDLAVGDFNGDGRDDVFWRHTATGWESLFHGKATYSSNEGFTHTLLYEAMTSDRRAIVGQFGHATGINTTGDDISWHYTGSRLNTGPTGGWWWCPCAI